MERKSPMTKKQLYYKYRDAGYPPDCTQIKRMNLTPRTRSNYEYYYKKDHGLIESDNLKKLAEEDGILGMKEPGTVAEKPPAPPPTPAPPPVVEALPVPAPPPPPDVPPPPGPSTAAVKDRPAPPPPPATPPQSDGRLVEEDPDDVDNEAGDPAVDSEKKPEKSKAEKEQPGEVVNGEGLRFAVTISVKTLMFYQYASSRSKYPLSFGDFVDACVEDAYMGRGYDLGLVKLGGNGHAKEGLPFDVRG